MPKKPEKESELAFEACLRAHGFAPEYEPAVDGKTKNLDFRLQYDANPLFFEVKEFAVKEIKTAKIESDFANLYEPIFRKIEDALEQLAQYAEFCCSLVLYAPDASFVALDPQSVIGGFLGPLSFKVFAEQVTGEPREVWFWDAAQGGYSLDAETLAPRNTYLSAIIVLEEFASGKFLTGGRWEKKRDETEAELGRALTDVETYALTQRFLSDNSNYAERVMRALVFEHPYADHPLPRDLFNGPYDERFGREGNHMVAVFAGEELAKLKATGVYPGKSPLFKALNNA